MWYTFASVNYLTKYMYVNLFIDFLRSQTIHFATATFHKIISTINSINDSDILSFLEIRSFAVITCLPLLLSFLWRIENFHLLPTIGVMRIKKYFFLLV